MQAKLRPISIVSILFVRCFIVFLLQRDRFYSRKVCRFVATIFNRMQSSPLLLGFVVVVVVALSGLWCLPDCSLASRTPCFEKCKLKCTFA